jgi:hypothetical protein
MKDKPKFTFRCIPQTYRFLNGNEKYQISAEGISEFARRVMVLRLTRLIEEELADELTELGFDPDTIVFEVQAMVRP